MLVCVIMVYIQTDLKNIENSRNDQPLKLEEELNLAKMTIPHSIKIPLFGVTGRPPTSLLRHQTLDFIQLNYHNFLKKIFIYSKQPQYLRIIVPRFKVGWIKTKGKIAHYI